METELIEYPSGGAVLYTPSNTEGYGVRIDILAGHYDGAAQRFGLAHATEHTVAGGASDVFPNRDMASQYRKRYGISPNAVTTTINTMYLVGNLPLGLYGFTEDELYKGTMDAIHHIASAKFDVQTAQLESGRLYKELVRRQGEAEHQDQMRFQPLSAQMYRGYIDSLSEGSIGTPENARDTTVEELQAFYNTHYMDARRWCVSIVGPKRPDGLIADIGTFMASLPPAEPGSPHPIQRKQFEMKGGVQQHGPPSGDSNRALIYLPLPLSCANNQRDIAALAILARMFSNFRIADAESGKSGYGMSNQFECGERNHMVLRVDYQDYPHAIEQMDRAFSELKRYAQGVGTEELEETRRAKMRDRLFNVISPYRVADDAAKSYLRDRRVPREGEEWDALMQVTPDDVERIAKHLVSGPVGLFCASTLVHSISLDEVQQMVAAPLPAKRPGTGQLPHTKSRNEDKPKGAR